MRNNRELNIRSLKGPRRKLILEVIDGKRYIIELDGQFHNISDDLDRDKKLIAMGYKVIRIDLGKEHLSRFVKPKDIRKCLRKYLSKV